MGYVKLVVVDSLRAQRRRPSGLYGPQRPVVESFEERRARLDIYDLIQAEMNEGYSLGVILGGVDSFVFEDVCSDGTTVSFPNREPTWGPAERLKGFILDVPRRDHAYLEKLANERGYRVEITDRVRDT